jgi:hypothetical protein
MELNIPIGHLFIYGLNVLQWGTGPQGALRNASDVQI